MEFQFPNRYLEKTTVKKTMKKSMLLSIITLLGCNDNSSTTPTTPSTPTPQIPQIPPAPDNNDDNLSNTPGKIVFIEVITDEEKKKILEKIYKSFQEADPSFVIPSDIDVNSLALPKQPQDLYWAFAEIESVTHLDLSNFDTSEVSDMQCTFAKCPNLKTLNLSNWNIKQCMYFGEMFAECHSLEEIIGIDGWGEIINKLPDPKRATKYMFRGCRKTQCIPQWYKDLHPDWEEYSKL